jgi:hypothetical protein
VYGCTDPLCAIRQVPCAEALAHAIIFGTFVASTVFFGRAVQVQRSHTRVVSAYGVSA